MEWWMNALMKSNTYNILRFELPTFHFSNIPIKLNYTDKDLYHILKKTY